MEQKKSIFVSNAMVLGKRGEKFSLSYEKITFLDNGCFDIYGDGTLTIDTLVNQKDSDLCPYEIRVIGNRGEDGCDSMHGEDGGEGKEGIPTEMEIRIGALEDSIRVISVGGEGGRGGKNSDGSCAKDGKDGRSCTDGQPGQAGEKGEITVGVWETGGINHES